MDDCTPDYHRDNRTARYDGHGIFLTYVCDRCRKRKLSGYRADIFERYEADEPIEPD